MKSRKKLLSVLVVLVTLVVVAGAALFMRFVQDSLWEKSVTDVLEVTAQGRHALDTYIEKDSDLLALFASELGLHDHDDVAGIVERLAVFDGGENDEGAVYLCIDLSTGAVYRTDTDEVAMLGPEELAAFEAPGEQGVIEPFLDERTGASMLGVYELFTFADGTSGFARKARPLNEIEERFSLSFYNNTGFSYVVNDVGDVVMRSQHRDSNRTFSNIFDIVGFEDNDADAVASFRVALESDASGVALFTHQGREYVFCYLPLASAEGWELLSIIPNDVLMEQANAVIQATLLLCAIIVGGLGVVLAVYWRGSLAHRREIEQMAYYDGLTGLYSVDKFTLEGNRRLAALARRGTGTGPGGVAVACVDIDSFKLINDVDGYERGDEVLRELADVVREAVEPEGFAARLSADYFQLLFPYVGREDAERVCEGVVERAQGILGNGKPIALHVGLCCSEDAPEARDVAELTDRARIAQSESRKRGMALCAYSEPMRATLLRRAELERTMEDALGAGEFFHLIQPKYDAAGGRVLGGEALVRWNRPGEGVVPPDQFIPLFEQNGFILRLDEFVLESVCRDLRARLDAGRPVAPISVNVSRLHVRRPDFLDSYVRIKERHRIPDGLCELELTESVVVEDLRGMCEVMERMREAGFRCAIDDFGSGYSSLNALKSLPADVLKLDRGFLREGPRAGAEETVVRTVIAMAKDLDMETVMEGVETPGQLAFLRTTECDMVQGFVFSRPLPPEEFYRLLEENA